MNKLITNIAWMLFEKITTIIGGIIITIYVARYLGPNDMGIINYALALIAILIPIAQLGADKLFFNIIAKSSKSGINIIHATKFSRLTIYIVLSTLTIIYFYKYKADDIASIILFIGIIISGLFQSIDIFKTYYDATLQSKINSIVTQFSLWTSLLSRLILVKISSPLLFFSLPYILNSSIPYLIKSKLFNKKHKNTLSKKTKKIYNRYAIKAGIPLAISSISIIMYTRLNQIILAEYGSLYDVGIYNAALTLAQGWIFIPIAISTSLFAKVIKMKSDYKFNGYSFIFLTNIIISLPIIFLYLFFYKEIILFTFGQEFIQSEIVILILTVTTLFSAIGGTASRVIIAENGYAFIMYKTVLLTIINIILGFMLISKYGLIGAAYTSLITEILGSTILNIPYKKGLIILLIIKSVKNINFYKKLS
ncbi:oligosaccharide flippase family protein [Proteus vulgaris]|uniref:oligosaccharide flippase family protein n=1 Tax=Proteus vulgaris TaxID=585 RepID=UPI0021B0F7D4|nr:oligosaccharide flippase family protein [Proteus vulgaris]MCT6516280.1 oligosaccharide flippase family protein [Proteus vulgaris]